MSFLAAVLASAGEVEMTDLDKSVSELKHKIANLEYEIKNAMEQRYMKFAVVSQDAASLLDTTKSYSNEINGLLSRINNQTKREVVDTMSDLKMFKSSLEENKYSLIVIEQILAVSMKLSNDGQNKLPLIKRIGNLHEAKEILTNNKDLAKLDVYKPLLREHQRLTDVLHSKCIGTWRKQIKWSENDIDSQESWRTQLKITGSQNDISENLYSLQYFNSLNAEIKLFANNLINLLIKPIIVQKLEVDILKTVHVSTMTLKVSNNKDECLSTIIKKLKTVFEFFVAFFPVNIEKVKIFSLLGSHACRPFCDVFKNVALFNAIPVKYNKINDFRDELDEVLEFIAYLTEKIGFIEIDNDELIKYISNVDNLFFTKIGQLYYDKARTIIKKDIHDLVEVKNQNICSDEDHLDNDDHEFCQNMFVYPQSKVSKSLLEFLHLIATIASEMSSVPENNSWRYHDILNNIIIMYEDMIPLQHCNTPEFEPRQSAILYNNIMYFVRKLIEMSPSYKNLLIVHLLEKLKNLASEILTSQCKQEVTKIEKIVNQSDIVSMAVNSNLTYSVEKTMLQCYDLLLVLSNLWKDILPSTVYNKFIGYMCNGLFECIISKMFTLEDISATSAEQYSLIFNKAIKDIPILFTESKEVHRYIPKWWQLNELVYVLSSSMKDIENRWADGKGPLADELKLEQIKSLLKALFQNTDRRAALLKYIAATAQS